MHRLTIVQGEHKVVAKPGVAIHTLLGSCIAVCLFDPVRRAGGMNHFLLDEPSGPQSGEKLSRYGVHAMELLVNALLAAGCVRERLRAHVYGGATMIAGLGDIGARNIAFARGFLTTERFEIRHEDVGGRHARRVEFVAHDGRARCRIVHEPLPAPAFPTPLARSGELELF